MKANSILEEISKIINPRDDEVGTLRCVVNGDLVGVPSNFADAIRNEGGEETLELFYHLVQEFLKLNFDKETNRVPNVVIFNIMNGECIPELRLVTTKGSREMRVRGRATN